MDISFAFSLRKTSYRIAVNKKIYTLVASNITFKNQENMNNASQTCQDDSTVPKILAMEEKNN